MSLLHRQSAHCVLAWRLDFEIVLLYQPDFIKVIESYSHPARCKRLLQIGVISKFIELTFASITLWIALAHYQPFWVDTT